MKRRILSIICALALCLPMALPARAYTPEEQYENLMAVIELIKQVGINSSPTDDPLKQGLTALFEKDPDSYGDLMDAMLSSYDNYSHFVPEGSYEVSYPSNSSYVGVGLTLEQYGQEIRVAAVTEKLVPLMALFYIVGAVVIVVLHAGNIPVAFRAIFRGAFNLQAAGGGTLGYGISQSLTWGFKRGAFSNEAGLGSAVMVNSSANVKEPVQQGMWGVFEIFADTIVVCTITALVILTTGVVDIESGSVLAGVQDNALVGQAFTAAFGSFGPKFIAISLLFFAYSTVLGWSHYGTKAVEYLFGQKGTRVYKVIFVGMVVVGATMKLGLAWDLSDTFNGLMMIPNLLAVLALSGTVVQITKNYLDRKVNGKDIPPMWSVFAEYQKAEEAEAAEEAKQAREAEALAELEILGGHAVNE